MCAAVQSCTYETGAFVKRPSSRMKPSAIERASARRIGWVRLTRTIVLGTVATILAIIWLGEQYGIDREVILKFLLTSAAFVGLLIVAGLSGAVLLWGVRKFWRR